MLPFNSTKTIMCVINELAANNVIDFNFDLQSTLNNKYQLFQDKYPEDFPTKIQYFGIGVQGFRWVDESNSLVEYKPDPRNMDLYRPIPIRCAPINNDLTPEEQINYRIRVLQTINGQQYWCYYLKVLKPLSRNYTLTQTNLLTGEESAINIDYNYLTPVPTELALPNQQDDTKEVNVYFDTVLEVTGEELAPVIDIVFSGDTSYFHISELGLYSGEDQLVTDQFGQSYTEAIYTQLVAHSCTTGTSLSQPSSKLEKIIRITQSTGFVL